MSPTTRCTVDDYLRLPEDWRAELIEGDLVMVPSPTPVHQVVLARLYLALAGHLGFSEEHRVLFAPLDLHIDLESVLQPDLLVLPEGWGPSKERIPAPLWVAEVVSPATAGRDRGEKLRIYARAGVREAWFVDPDARRIEAVDLASGRIRSFEASDAAKSGIFPGLSVPVGALFPA